MNYKSLAIQLGIMGTVRGRELTASCPLHVERNPSFSLNIETGLWQCFSRCGGGNFIQLVERKLGYSHQEAENWIATNGQANSVDQLMATIEKIIAPPQGLSGPATEVNNIWRDQYLACNNNVMPQWLMDRGFSWDTINHWRFVYNFGMDALIVPVIWNDEWVGTVTRNTQPHLPKYQNSLGLPRERIFFGEISRSRRDIIICEGLLDVVWLWQLGYHAVSVLGSSLTWQQIQILKALQIGEIILAFDNDDAGRKATSSAVRDLQAAGWLGFQLKSIHFPGRDRNDPGYKKDPNDCPPDVFGKLFEERKVVLA